MSDAGRRPGGRRDRRGHVVTLGENGMLHLRGVTWRAAGAAAKAAARAAARAAQDAELERLLLALGDGAA